MDALSCDSSPPPTLPNRMRPLDHYKNKPQDPTLRREPISDREQFVATPYPKKYGRTVGLILQAIGKAMANPGVNQRLWDPLRSPSRKQHTYMAIKAAELIAKLELNDLIVVDEQRFLFVRSENFGFRFVKIEGSVDG